MNEGVDPWREFPGTAQGVVGSGGTRYRGGEGEEGVDWGDLVRVKEERIPFGFGHSLVQHLFLLLHDLQGGEDQRRKEMKL